MKILIVDDEPPARDRLRRLLEEMDDWDVVGEADNGQSALEQSFLRNPDVILMDIRMPGMDGIEAARHLTTLDDPPAVIFTTAFDQYAIDAFEAQAIGYLMKPVRKERLARALRHAARLTRRQLSTLAESRANSARRTHICAKMGDELRLISLKDIWYFRAEQKYVCVKHGEGEVLIDEPLKSLAEEFDADFVRIHRNTLVSLDYLVAVEKNADGGYYARLRTTDERLPVSRRHVAALESGFEPDEHSFTDRYTKEPACVVAGRTRGEALEASTR